jgi:hypothetical protein
MPAANFVAVKNPFAANPMKVARKLRLSRLCCTREA